MNADAISRAHQLLRQARAAVITSDIRAALDHLQHALKLVPAHPQARLLHARLLLRSNRPAEALTSLSTLDHYRPAIRLASDRFQLAMLTLRAQCLLAMHRVDEAIDVLDQAVEICPSDERACTIRAMALVQVGHVDEAAAALEHLSSHHPRSRRVARLLADALELAGQPGRALAIHEKWKLDVDPLHAARLASRAGLRADALERYEQLLTTATDEADLFCEAAQVADEASDMPRVHRWLDAALELEPHNPRALELKALALMRQGDFALATAKWTTLCRRDASSRMARAGFTVCAVIRGGRDLPDAAFTSDPDTRRLMARLWLIALEGQLAHRITTGSPSAASAASGSILQTLLRESAAVLEQAAANRPAHADLHYHRAESAEALGPGYIAAVRRRVDRLLTARQFDAAAAILQAAADHRSDRLTDQPDLFDLHLSVLVARDGALAGRLALGSASIDDLHRQRLITVVSQKLTDLGMIDLAAQWRQTTTGWSDDEASTSTDLRRAA
jgi:tetratricopeptide (TPR) repeat protein